MKSPLAQTISRRGALRWSAGGAALLGTSCHGLPARAAEASVAQFGARGDGLHDDTAAFQRACDDLAGGGTLQVPRGIYLIDQVAIRHRNIRIALADGVVLRKRPPAGLESRGLFVLDGLQDAGFELSGGRIDLNGEGPRGIGQAGRIPNRYAPLIVKTMISIAGPPNAAVFARRSSGIAVTGCTIVNSGESGLLFRNCGQVRVRDSDFSNIANYGIEFSLVAADSDGGSGPMPARNDCEVSGCRFENIDDYGLGSGNGCGVGGGGGTALGMFLNYKISDCTFVRCHRDVHFEFAEGSWIEQLEIARVTSTDARQGSIGLVNVRRSSVHDVVIDNPGSAPTALLVPQRPELYGIVLSTGFSDIRLANITVRDRRSGRLFAAGGASIDQESTRLTTAADVFAPGDAGTWIGILGGNPHGCAYVGRIVSVVSAREVQLDLPAGADVRGGRIAVGGVTRNGVILTAGSDVAFDNVTIEAGAAGDTASEAEAAAVRMSGMEGEVSFARTVLRAPGGGHKAAGIRVTGGRARLTGLDTTQVEGFARPLLQSD
jgi:hypothetical protein